DRFRQRTEQIENVCNAHHHQEAATEEKRHAESELERCEVEAMKGMVEPKGQPVGDPAAEAKRDIVANAATLPPRPGALLKRSAVIGRTHRHHRKAPLARMILPQFHGAGSALHDKS